MNQNEVIQPLNVVGATIIIQIIILIGIAFSSIIVKSSDRYNNSFVDRKDASYWQIISFPIFIALVISIVVLMLSEVMYDKVWGAFFQGLGINTILTNTSVNIVFTTDLILIGYFIYITGGSERSPYSPMLLTIPALAIFLRLSANSFVTLAIFSALIYLMLLYPFRISNREVKVIPAKAFMNIYCLVLSMLTGYITKPIPMVEMVGN